MGKPSLDDPDMSLSELLRAWPQTAPVFLRHQMLCVGCLVAPFHTITDACTEYHLKEVDFLQELRQAISETR